MCKQISFLTNLFAMGVLSSPGKCCSKARTTQLAVMVARIMYSNGVKARKLKKGLSARVSAQCLLKVTEKHDKQFCANRSTLSD